MDARQELEELRRIDELERKAAATKGGGQAITLADAGNLAGGTFAGPTATDIKEGTTLNEPVPKELGGTLAIEPLKKPAPKTTQSSLPATMAVVTKPKPKPVAVKPEQPDEFRTGLATSVYKTARGLSPILPKAIEKYLPSKEMLHEWEHPVKPSFTREAGQAAGDIAQTYATGGTNVLYNAAAGGLFGGIQNEDDRLKGAASGIVGSLGGQGLVHLLGHAGTAALSHLAPITEEAKQLLAQGIVPTVGQAVDRLTKRGAFLHGVEEVGSRSKLLRPGVVNQTAQAEQQLTEKALADTGLKVPDIKLPLKERVFHMRKQVGAEYDKALAGLNHTRDPALDASLAAIPTRRTLAGSDLKDYNRTIDTVYGGKFDQNKITQIPLATLQRSRDTLREAADASSGSLKDAYIDAIKLVDSQVNREAGVAGRNLAPIDAKYAMFIPIESAVLKTKGANYPTAVQYANAVEANARAIGKHPGDPSAPGASLATPASRVMTKTPSGSALTDIALSAGTGGLLGPVGYVLPHAAMALGSYATNNPVARAMMMGSKEARNKVLEGLRKANRVMHSIGTTTGTHEGEK